MVRLRLLGVARDRHHKSRWEAVDPAFPPDTPSPKRPLYAITQKLVPRPVEFCLPLCHATNGEFSDDARGSHGRAGIHPRRKPTRASFSTPCAGSLAQPPPCGVDVRAFCRAPLVTSHSSLLTDFLIGNKVTIEFGITCSKQTRGTNSNR